jgi:hypothetical protein
VHNREENENTHTHIGELLPHTPTLFNRVSSCEDAQLCTPQARRSLTSSTLPNEQNTYSPRGLSSTTRMSAEHAATDGVHSGAETPALAEVDGKAGDRGDGVDAADANEEDGDAPDVDGEGTAEEDADVADIGDEHVDAADVDDEDSDAVDVEKEDGDEEDVNVANNDEVDVDEDVTAPPESPVDAGGCRRS